MGVELTKVGTSFRTDWFRATPDIFVAIPEPHYEDNPEAARANSAMMRSLARGLGRKCGFVIVMSNHISQDAESQKVYAEISPPDMVYGTALVADTALARAISSFFLGLSKPGVPVRLVRSIEEGLVWLESLPKTWTLILATALAGRPRIHRGGQGRRVWSLIGIDPGDRQRRRRWPMN